MADHDVIVLGLDVNGIVVAQSYGMRYYLTWCCAASAKGSIAGGYPATVCRQCYAEIDDAMGAEPNKIVTPFGDGIPYDYFIEHVRPDLLKGEAS